jgi:hypothetical protein
MFKPTKRDIKRYQGMSVCILTPCGSYNVSARFAQDLANMIAYSWLHGLKIYQMGITERMVVDWARNDLARKARDHVNEYTDKKFTHVLWLDDDHVFNPDLALWLAREEFDMVSALYYGRTAPHYPVVYVKSQEMRDKDSSRENEEYIHYPLIEVPEKLFRCDAVGFGALLMRRDVFDRVPEPWFTLDWRAGEDIAFCVKAKAHGIDIMCDGRYKLGHIGPPPIVTHKTYAKAQEESPEQFESQKVKVLLNA